MENEGFKEQPHPAHKKIKISEEELNALKDKAAKADDCLDKMLRMQADYDNRRKRQDREKTDFIRFANESLIADLLNVADDFERAIDSAKNSNEAKALVQGIEMIKQHFQGTLEDHGLKKIDPKGQVFDPEKHEAVAHIEDDEHPENMVLEVMRNGYELNGKVLRPAVVKVSKKRTEEGKSSTEKDKSEEVS